MIFYQDGSYYEGPLLDGYAINVGKYYYRTSTTQIKSHICIDGKIHTTNYAWEFIDSVNARLIDEYTTVNCEKCSYKGRFINGLLHGLVVKKTFEEKTKVECIYRVGICVGRQKIKINNMVKYIENDFNLIESNKYELVYRNNRTNAGYYIKMHKSRKNNEFVRYNVYHRIYIHYALHDKRVICVDRMCSVSKRIVDNDGTILFNRHRYDINGQRFVM